MVVMERPVSAGSGSQAAAHRLAIHMDGAGTAQSLTAAKARRGQAEQITQDPQQWHIINCVDRQRAAIDLELDLGHVKSGCDWMMFNYTGASPAATSGEVKGDRCLPCNGQEQVR